MQSSSPGQSGPGMGTQGRQDGQFRPDMGTQGGQFGPGMEQASDQTNVSTIDPQTVLIILVICAGVLTAGIILASKFKSRNVL